MTQKMRDDKPFTGVDYSDRRYECHYDNGYFHRIDGPAVIYKGDHYRWFLHGFEYGFDEWLYRLAIDDEEHATLMKLEWG